MSAKDQLDPKNLPRRDEQRQQLAQDLVRRTREAQQYGELISAMLYASDALMLYPEEPSLLALVDELARATPDPLSLLPVATGAIHVATAAVRARFLAYQGKLLEALELIGAVVRVAPSLPYLPWVRPWLNAQTLPSLGWEAVNDNLVRTGLTLISKVPPKPKADDPRLPNVRAAVDIFSILRGMYTNEVMIFAGEALLRRRLGDVNGALALGSDAATRFPQDWFARIALMNALCDAGRPQEALPQARICLQIDPEDFSPLHDVAWSYIQNNRLQEALPVLDELMVKQPAYPGAKATLHYVRWKVYAKPEDRLALLTIRERRWWDETATDLADEIDPPIDYYTVLPGPGDATAAAARDLVSKLAPIVRCCGLGISVGMGLRSHTLESPSAAFAFDFGLRALGASGSFEIAVEEVQTPDPRALKAQVQHCLWAYEGTNARRLLGGADPRIQQAIAGIARELFRKDIWEPRAKALAAQTGPAWVPQLLSLMTDPPFPPDDAGFDAITWLYRCQVATAVVLAHIDPWNANSVGRGALYSLVLGPTDWATSAGIIAMAWRAYDEPSVRADVEPLFAWLRGQIPQHGFTCWEYPLAASWRGLPGLAPELQQNLDAWIVNYDETVGEKNWASTPERKFGGLTLEEYAEFSWDRDRLMSNVAYAGPGAAIAAFAFGAPPAELAQLCQKFNVPLRHPETGHVHPFIDAWQEMLNEDPDLHEEFIELQRTMQLRKLGVSGEEQAALDEIRDGNMDMHLRMAQAQRAQRDVRQGNAGDPDPIVFPGQKVQKLSDYVSILKRMQTGDMNGALAAYGLDFMSYGSVATAWGAKMAADPELTEKFSKMMAS